MSKIQERLSKETGLPVYVIEKIMTSAPSRYKDFYIPKRNGTQRLVSQPAREVKLIQRAFIDIVLQKLPVHDAAKAYRNGMSTRDNATPHIGNGPILKLDFRNFFPSIRHTDWREYCRLSGCLTERADVEITSLLLFRRLPQQKSLRLAIGAPSSPILSNILMYDFDMQISNKILQDRVTYTRYADDLTFSAPRAGFLKDVIKNVQIVIKTMRHPRLQLNLEKTSFITSKFRRSVTGLILTNDGLVTIGRDKKREIRSAIFNIIGKDVSPEELARLSGMLSYVNSVEPNYILKLRDKFGDFNIDRLLHRRQL